MAFAKSLKVEIERPRPERKKVVEPSDLSLPDYGGSERDEIRKRLEPFKAHQERFMREPRGTCRVTAASDQANHEILGEIKFAESS